MEECNSTHVFQGKCVLELGHSGEHVFRNPDGGSAVEKAKMVTGRDPEFQMQLDERAKRGNRS
jgi:hypothetical protein